MTVYVVVSDCGLNGPHVHGVYTERPTDKDVETFVNTFNDWPSGHRGVVAGTTGYQNTQILEFELDSSLQ